MVKIFFFSISLGNTDHALGNEADAERVAQSLLDASEKESKVTIGKNDVTKDPDTNTKIVPISAESNSKTPPSRLETVSRELIGNFMRDKCFETF